MPISMSYKNSILLFVTVGLLASCSKLWMDMVPTITNDEQILISNKSSLDRDIVTRPVTYSECIDMGGKKIAWWDSEDICLREDNITYSSWDYVYFPDYRVNNFMQQTFSLVTDHNDKDDLIERWAKHGTWYDKINNTGDIMNEIENDTINCEWEKCFLPEVPIYDIGNRRIQAAEFEDNVGMVTIMVVYHIPTKTYSYKSDLDMFGPINIIWWMGRNQKTIELCGSDNITQTVSVESDMPSSFYVGEREYKIQSLTNKRNINSQRSSNEFGEIKKLKKIYSLSDIDSVIADIKKNINNNAALYHSYLLRFKEYPHWWVMYSYEWPKKQPEIVMQRTWWNIPMDENGNIIDLELTKQILCWSEKRHPFSQELCPQKEWPIKHRGLKDMISFDEEKESTLQYINPEKSRDGYVYNESVLPLWKVIEQNDDYVMLTGVKGVSFGNSAAWCKPVVYMYDTKERKNSLTVTLPSKSYFTKIIPDFTHAQTRDFTSDKDSNISVSKQKYPYLYYSTKRANYEYNTYGRVVRAIDVPFFLDDKLTKMNFNEKEKADFLEYRLPQFTTGYNYFISFAYADKLEKYAQLHFAIPPQKIFRVFMEARQIDITEHPTFDLRHPHRGDKKLLQQFERGSSYDVLERGGELIKQ